MNIHTDREVNILTTRLRELGCAVVCFIPEELLGANPDLVEDRLVEVGWQVIDSLATEPREGE